MSANHKNLSEIHHLHSSGDLGFGIVTYRPNGRLGPRRQEHFQLVVLHRGHLRVTLDGKTHFVGENQGILLRPGSEESFQFTETAETTHSWCQIPESQIPVDLRIPDDYCHVAASVERSLVESMRAGWRRNPAVTDSRSRRQLTAEVLAAMWEYCRGLPEVEISPLPEALRRAERRIQEKMDSPISLDELARAAGVSKGHLILLARRHWGTTPVEAIWNQRLERAASLLRETGLSVSEVSDRTGFGNAFHFSRRFKQRFGQAPREWRRIQWTGI